MSLWVKPPPVSRAPEPAYLERILPRCAPLSYSARWLLVWLASRPGCESRLGHAAAAAEARMNHTTFKRAVSALVHHGLVDRFRVATGRDGQPPAGLRLTERFWSGESSTEAVETSEKPR